MSECVMPRRGGKEFHIPTFVQSGVSTFNCETLGEGYFLIAAISGGASGLYIQDTSHQVGMYPYGDGLYRSCAIVRVEKSGSSYNIYVERGNGTAEQLLLTGVTNTTLINGYYSAVYKMD